MLIKKVAKINYVATEESMSTFLLQRTGEKSPGGPLPIEVGLQIFENTRPLFGAVVGKAEPVRMRWLREAECDRPQWVS